MSDLTERLIALRQRRDIRCNYDGDYTANTTDAILQKRRHSRYSRVGSSNASNRIAELEGELRRERDSHTETLRDYEALEAERDRLREALGELVRAVDDYAAVGVGEAQARAAARAALNPEDDDDE